MINWDTEGIEYESKCLFIYKISLMVFSHKFSKGLFKEMLRSMKLWTSFICLLDTK